MPISVSCSACGKQYNVKDEAAGKKFKCKECEAIVEVPDGSPQPTSAAAESFGESDNPFANLDFGDPVAAPAPMPRRRSSTGAKRNSSPDSIRTTLPAIFLYVVCGLSIAYSILSIVVQLLGIEPPGGGIAGPQDEMAEQVGKVFGMLILVGFMIRDLFIVYAASRMQTRTSYGFALTGAIISVIPCLGSPCCVLGVPFGIWALVVLNDDAIKSDFR